MPIQTVNSAKFLPGLFNDLQNDYVGLDIVNSSLTICTKQSASVANSLDVLETRMDTPLHSHTPFGKAQNPEPKSFCSTSTAGKTENNLSVSFDCFIREKRVPLNLR